MLRFDCFDPWHAVSEQFTDKTGITSSANDGYGWARPSPVLPASPPASWWVVVVAGGDDDAHARTMEATMTEGPAMRFSTPRLYQVPARRRSSTHTPAAARGVKPATAPPRRNT